MVRDFKTVTSSTRPIASGLLERNPPLEALMKLDIEKIDRAVLALLYLGLHDGERTWKGFDWDAMNRLHEKGYISDPVGKAESVVFTEETCRIRAASG